MSAAKRQNTLSGFPFTSTCMRVYLLRVLVRHHCQRLEDKTLLAHVCECVCARALRAADEPVSESRLATLVFTVPLQLQRPFNLKTSQFESPFAHVASVSPPAK